MENDFFFKFYCDVDSKYSIIIEANGIVLYAYLLEEEEIVSDVWLYNFNQVPRKTKWDSVDDLPFENISHLIKPLSEQVVFRQFHEDDIKWVFKNSLLDRVEIIKDEIIFCQMQPNKAPGYSCNALQSGALARVELIN